ELCRLERLLLELVEKCLQIFFAVYEALVAGGLAHFLAPVLDELLYLLEAFEDSYMSVFGLAVENSADSGVILGVLRHNDQIFRIHAFGELEFALLPDLGDILAPGILHRRDEGVRTAQEKDLRPERIAASENREVLLHYRFK